MIIAVFTEDHLVEQPAIQLMQHELGWEVERNIEHRTLNIEHRSEEKRNPWTDPAFQRLNPELPVEAKWEIERSGFPLVVGSLVFKQSP